MERSIHTSTWSIIDDNSESVFKTFLFSYNLCSVEKMTKNFTMSLLSLHDQIEVYGLKKI